MITILATYIFYFYIYIIFYPEWYDADSLKQKQQQTHTNKAFF